ncbi:MAG TPA: MaoC/PaaZ C-terminal domain-containing protein [Thermoleophilaceae bacterium]|nr:MaoC/PaaZ C-terminal domain-containing protein [Thermoleophilaceae bacterium]
METTELESPPSLTALYGRAVVVPVLPGGGDELPDRRLVLRDAEVREEHVAEYARVCGFGLANEVPGTYPHVLAFPLHMSLMTDRAFPFSVLGLVHVVNRIEVLRPIAVGARLDVCVWTEDLRPHRRGRQFDVVAEAETGGSVAWRGRSTYLKQGGGNGDSAPRRDDREAAGELAACAEWRIPGDVGRRYAAVSGDRNPIHMHSLPARLFGFPGAIAHGMWTKARCLAAFDGRVRSPYTVEVEFRAPLLIPGRAHLRSGGADRDWAFRLESPDGERVHLAGSIA